MQVGLKRASESKTLFNGDIDLLELEVIYHEDYHLQVKVIFAH